MNIIAKAKKIYSELPPFLKPKVVRATYAGEVMNLKYSDNSVRTYIGSGTVWRSYPQMTRCSTYKEAMLADIYKYIKQWGNDYPDSHLKHPKQLKA